MASDPFEILGLRRGASEDEIRAAYKEQVARYHPDKHKGNPLEDLAAAKLVEINRAYDILTKGVAERERVEAGATTSARPARSVSAPRRPEAATSAMKLVRSLGLIVTLLFLVRFGLVLGRQILALVRGVAIGILWILRLSPVLAIAVVMALALGAGMLVRSRKGHG
jgi:preprotein translocase subunit Sec63